MQKDHRDELWRYLQMNPGWHTSSELAVAIGVSTRSIKRYAKDLADSSAIFVSKKGYQINAEKAPAKDNSDSNNIVHVLANDLTTKDSINMYDICERFYISESSAIKVMKIVAEYVSKFQLTLQHSGDDYSLVGSEIQKRRLISDVVYQESSHAFMGTDMIQENFPEVDVRRISTVIKAQASRHNVYLNAFDFNNILLHLVIAVNRTMNGYSPRNRAVINEPGADHSQQIEFSQDLISEIEAATAVHFMSEERSSLDLMIRFSITRKHGRLGDTIQPETAMIVDRLIQYVNTTLNIDLSTLNFRDQFAIHIQRLIDRSKQGYVERNPLMNKVRDSSPLIYECAVLISKQLEQLKQIKLADDEIAYIAMHIGNAASEYIAETHKLYVVVMVPDYQGDWHEFVSQLERLFSRDVVIARVVHTPDQIRAENLSRKIDFVIQINTEYDFKEIRHVSISQFLTQLDYKAVANEITTVRSDSENDKFREEVLDFFPRDNFLLLQEDISRDELFKLVCDRLEKKSVVGPKFKDQLIQREIMSGTAFGRVAIPHSFEMTAFRTEGYIVIAPKGITWNAEHTHVKLVFLLAVNKDNKSTYQNVFDGLSQVAVDAENLAKLIKAHSYEEFVETLVTLENQ